MGVFYHSVGTEGKNVFASWIYQDSLLKGCVSMQESQSFHHYQCCKDYMFVTAGQLDGET